MFGKGLTDAIIDAATFEAAHPELKSVIVTTTATPTTYVANDHLYFCYFQRSSNCTFDDQAVCAKATLDACVRMDTATYPLYVRASEARVVVQGMTSTRYSYSLHFDDQCAHGALGFNVTGEGMGVDECHVVSGGLSTVRAV